MRKSTGARDREPYVKSCQSDSFDALIRCSASGTQFRTVQSSPVAEAKSIYAPDFGEAARRFYFKQLPQCDEDSGSGKTQATRLSQGMVPRLRYLKDNDEQDSVIAAPSPYFEETLLD